MTDRSAADPADIARWQANLKLERDAVRLCDGLRQVSIGGAAALVTFIVGSLIGISGVG